MSITRPQTAMILALALGVVACRKDEGRDVRGSGGSLPSGGVIATGGGVTTGGASGGGGSARTTGDSDGGGATDTDGGPAPCPSGWTLAWRDEFEGNAGNPADSSRRGYETGNGSGGWGNNELEYYRAENGVLDGQGNLVVTAKHESTGGFQYTSARVKTQGRASWTYGRFEARIKLPFGQGIWPAFWMLGSDINTTSWPACGEIDVMENLGRTPGKVHGTLHGPGYSGGAGLTATFTLPDGARFTDDFHRFAVEWEPETIRWYVDDTLYSTKTPADIGKGNTWVFGKPLFLLLNLAVGGNWPGSPDTTTVFPQSMTVDSVRVCLR